MWYKTPILWEILEQITRNLQIPQQSQHLLLGHFFQESESMQWASEEVKCKISAEFPAATWERTILSMQLSQFFRCLQHHMPPAPHLHEGFKTKITLLVFVSTVSDDHKMLSKQQRSSVIRTATERSLKQCPTLRAEGKTKGKSPHPLPILYHDRKMSSSWLWEMPLTSKFSFPWRIYNVMAATMPFF